MSQIIYAPFGALNQLHSAFGRAFDDRTAPDAKVANDETGAWVPQVDIKEDEQGFSVLMDLPGVDPKQVAVTIDRDILTIRGNRTLQDNEDKNEDTNEKTHEKKSGSKSDYKRRERAGGAFVRQFTLPEAVDGNSVSAKSTHGVLTVRIPKGERNKPLNIAIAT
jgi:HSP20 family protein